MKATPETISKQVSLDSHLFFGFLFGAALAILIRTSDHREELTQIALNGVYPLGFVFLQLVFLVLAPFIFFSVSVAIGNIRNHSNGVKLTTQLTFFYLVTTLIAIVIGQSLVVYFQPGLDFPEATLVKSTGSLEFLSLSNVLRPLFGFSALATISSGKLTLVYLSSVLMGIIVAIAPAKQSAYILYLLRTGRDVCAYPFEKLMLFAPAAIAALTLGAVCRFEASWAGALMGYLGVMVAGLFLQMFVVYPLILVYWLKYPAREFFIRARSAIFTAAVFSTSGSAVVPVTIRTLKDRFGVPESISSIAATLGANFNLNGTALFEAVVVIFLAQVFEIDFTLFDHLVLMGFVLVTCVGMPGVPGSAIPVLAACLSTIGIPPEGLSLIVGLDGLLIMSRSAVNITGDIIAAIYLHQVVGSEARSAKAAGAQLPIKYPLVPKSRST